MAGARAPDLTSLDGLYNHNERQSWLEKRFALLAQRNLREECPPFPRQMNIETTNICNHRCNVCAITAMQRPARAMDPALFRRLVAEAFDLGTREIGLFAGAEPMTSKHIEDHVRYCKALGYTYVYISTNGSIGGPDRYCRLLDAGLDSVKFSINAGTRDLYREVHGRDHFDQVIATVRAVAAHARGLDRPIFVGVSSVLTPRTRDSFSDLVRLLGDRVDEVVAYDSHNQAGQRMDLPPPPFRECENPFAKLHISREGYLRACCNDYENDLAIADLNHTSLADAWQGTVFRAFRRRHLEGRLEGTRCDACLTGAKRPHRSLNPALSAAAPEKP